MNTSLQNYSQLPFGIFVVSNEECSLEDIKIDTIHELVNTHKVVIFRGFYPLEGDAFPNYCRKLGSLLEWEFGTVNELQINPQKNNYLYTNAAVPFHWDGAFIGKIPHYIVFNCISCDAGSGGETLFTDTTQLLAQLTTEEHELWQHINITYTTEKVVHYGGEFTSPLLARHPITGEEVLRYAEPVVDINPVSLQIQGISPAEHNYFIQSMQKRLYSETVCYEHQWKEGDIVIADNHALLHGRRPLASKARKLRRVNVL
ncbi:MAG: TauD/TfdA family dioxygenase [Scytonematopsis contorta HA4267-MV1]|jgi:alpha-ketoglutarate-dependent taurine dioxygenase|nr:TauD/TfdA family dioxygenase [Scytonematopsis contorta HA4267-MV1]